MDVRKFRKSLIAAGIPLGGPEAKFAQVGRKSLAAMIDAGLMPSHRVVDVGAGSMRVGWWLVHYIDPANYYAIEPLRERIDTAARMLGVQINASYNDDFAFPDVAVDFAIARSVWSHASKVQIAKMIAEFGRTATPGAGFLASVRPAATEAEDYRGDEWVGKGPDSDDPGMVNHSLDWIEAEGDRHGLTMKVDGELNSQTWVLLRSPR
jgi:hypothetical protein